MSSLAVSGGEIGTVCPNIASCYPQKYIFVRITKLQSVIVKAEQGKRRTTSSGARAVSEQTYFWR
jgi:hypothetical protein